MIEKHGDYTKWSSVWSRCRDVVAGQDAVHAGGEKYLPRLGGQDDTQYAAFVERTRFFNASDRTVAGTAGLSSRKPVMAIPEDIAFEENAHHTDRSLSEYLNFVLKEVLTVGRAGTLVDYPQTGSATTTAAAEAQNLSPRGCFYATENILNWQFGYVGNKYQVVYLMLFDGTRKEGSVTVYEYRELLLEDGVYIQRKMEATSADSDPEQVDEDILPKMNGNFMDFIPFVLHTAGGREDEVGKPPLLDLIDTNLKHYQLKADHLHGLHYVALPTPYILGVDADEAPDTIGPQRIWAIGNESASVGMLEFSGSGLSAVRDELVAIETNMAQLGSRMLAPDTTTQNETATATSIKTMSETSVLACVVKIIS